ncbi:MAG: hypothetical protein WCJ25_04130 [Candidatus Moraniibacteriota bacterium]
MKSESNRLPLIRKDLKSFLLSEEGKMTKKDIAKMTAVIVAVASVVGVAVKPSDSLASCVHGSHASHFSGGGCSSVSW